MCLGYSVVAWAQVPSSEPTVSAEAILATAKVDKPEVVLSGITQDLIIKIEASEGNTFSVDGLGQVAVNGGILKFQDVVIPDPLVLRDGELRTILENVYIPGWLSILPPILAILFALIFHEVLLALLLGVFSGVFILSGFNPITAIFSTFDDKLVSELADTGHIRILFFTIGMAGLIGLLRSSGALIDLIDRIRHRVQSPRSGMIATWVAGMLIFFDDYANSLLVGNMLRPLTDKLRISREKLSFIVDSTAAPVACMFISTWIGTEVSIMQESYQTIDPTVGGMALFFASTPYRFYPIFMLFFVLFVCITDRDFGPMHKAEMRARTTGKVLADNAVPLQDDEAQAFDERSKDAKWPVALFPVASMVIFIISYIYVSGAEAAGYNAPLMDILNESSASSSLMFGPILGVVVFAIMTIGKFSMQEFFGTFVKGAKTVMIAVFILTLAWSIGTVCKELETARYLVSLFGDSVPPIALPTLAFFLSAVTAFSTGTSWGTMAIIYPIIVPLSYHVIVATGSDPATTEMIMYAVLGSILSGATFGDHTSPISDTTLFSSMASGADHIDHVRTQMPYAVVVALIAVVFGYIPVSMGLNPVVANILGVIACFVLVRLFGKKNPVSQFASNSVDRSVVRE